MSDAKRGLAWNGGVKPKKPSEGFATSVGMTVSSGGARPAGPAPRATERGETFFDGTPEGLNVDVQRMGEKRGPEVVRPTGRVRLEPT